MAKKYNKIIDIETVRHRDRRKNIPTAEHEPLVPEEQKSPVQIAYARRNRDLDPQLVWRGKDEQDWSDLVVHAPPLYIQEKVHPKVLIDDLLRQSRERQSEEAGAIADLYADFNGIPEGVEKTEFYQHDQNWSNRMILGDSLQVMASLAEREGLRGKVQCIYLDPPYGIKFNSNFQWSTTSRDVKDGKAEHISREPEQVKAFRDTWRDGIHSYLTYLRDRLTVARDLLTDSGSIFVQIGDENVHRVRAVMDEVFGETNFVTSVLYRTTGGFSTNGLSRIGDNILWYAKVVDAAKFRGLCAPKSHTEDQNYRMLEDEKLESFPMSGGQQSGTEPLPSGSRVWRYDNATGQGAVDAQTPIELEGQIFHPPKNTHWKANYPTGMERLKRAARLIGGGRTVSYKRYFCDYAVKPITATWLDTGVSGFASDKLYVVQTLPEVAQRCILMTTDPGDLVVDPTCGSGTTATVAEQWGRRWITIDTSRVALALARARVMGARYPYYLLADSREGRQKEAEIIGKIPPSPPFSKGGITEGEITGKSLHNPPFSKEGTEKDSGDIRQGFVYERVPHITLKSIANNAEIDVIWEKWQQTLEPLREALNKAMGTHWEEWEIPRELSKSVRPEPVEGRASTSSARTTSTNATQKDSTDSTLKPEKILHDWWQARIARQGEIDASIAAKAEFEYLYDKPYTDNKRVRVAGPFTVESLSPHRVLAVAADDSLIEGHEIRHPHTEYDAKPDFATLMLENLKTAGVQQAHKEDRIVFTSVSGWPGEYLCAEGRYLEGETERRAGIFIGPEFGTVSRPDLVAAAREAADARFDVLIACAFNFDAHSAEFEKLGRVPVLKARMNPDLHMAGELKNTGKGNLFVVFGEPDIQIEKAADKQIQVRVRGVDVFRPQTGEIESGGTENIALWMIDTDYNEESFFVRQAYFLGGNDPYKSLKTTLKAEIDAEAWASLNREVSRPFPKPKSGRIAVKVINHLGDEVMKIFAAG